MPHQQGSQLSPTSSTSSRTTTPTSPHFHSHQRSQSSLSRPVVGHAYAQPGSRPSTSTGAGSILHPRPITPALYRAPSNQPFLAYVKSWGEDEINQFLSIFNCSHHAAAFQRNDIDGKCILDLDTNNLKEIGVVKIGERIKIHNGIKDLRKRAANSNQHAQLRSTSRIELRLNGAATPPLDNVPSPTTNGSLYTRDNHPASGLKRLGSARPPPLDLHTQQARSNIPQAYQNVPTSIDSRTVTTPKAIPSHPPVPSRNVSSTSTASDVTVVPASHGSTITAMSRHLLLLPLEGSTFEPRPLETQVDALQAQLILIQPNSPIDLFHPTPVSLRQQSMLPRSGMPKVERLLRQLTKALVNRKPKVLPRKGAISHRPSSSGRTCRTESTRA
jgi:hypothetical protein